MRHCHLNRVLPRHPPLQHLRQQLLPAALLLPVHRQTALDVGAVGRGCDEQLRRPGGCSEGCYRSRGRGTRAGPLRRPAGCGEWCCRRWCRGRAEQLRRPGRCGEWCCRRRGRGRAGPRIDRALQAQAEHWSAPNWLAEWTSHAEAGRSKQIRRVAKTEDCRFMSQKARDANGVAGRPASHEALQPQKYCLLAAEVVGCSASLLQVSVSLLQVCTVSHQRG